MLRSKLKQAIAEAVQTNYGDVAFPDFSVDVPEMAEHGDYACNVAMMLARVAKKKSYGNCASACIGVGKKCAGFD